MLSVNTFLAPSRTIRMNVFLGITVQVGRVLGFLRVVSVPALLDA
jgi:hypothetical protein